MSEHAVTVALAVSYNATIVHELSATTVVEDVSAVVPALVAVLAESGWPDCFAPV